VGRGRSLRKILRETSHSILKQYSHRVHGGFVGESLTRAFEQDPFMRSLVPDDGIFMKKGPIIYKWWVWVCSRSYKMSEVYEDKETGEYNCVASWEPESDSLMGVARSLIFLCIITFHLGFSFAAQYLNIIWDLHHLREIKAPDANYHLLVIGTDPTFQSKGAGSETIQVGLDRADELQVDCYLESSNLRNIGFYRRHGFKIVGFYRAEIRGTNGETGRSLLTLMLRKPQRQ